MKFKITLITLLAAIFILCVSCKKESQKSEIVDTPSLAAENASWMDAFNSWDSIGDHYVDSAILILPDNSVIEGKANVLEYYNKNASGKIVSIKEEYSIFKDFFAFQIGTYTLDSGKTMAFATVYQKTSDSWARKLEYWDLTVEGAQLNKEAILSDFAGYVEAAGKGDLAGYMNMYTTACIDLEPYVTAYNKKEIQTVMGPYVLDMKYKIDATPKKFIPVTPSLAYEIGEVVWQLGSAQETNLVYFYSWLLGQDGKWRKDKVIMQGDNDVWD